MVASASYHKPKKKSSSHKSYKGDSGYKGYKGKKAGKKGKSHASKHFDKKGGKKGGHHDSKKYHGDWKKGNKGHKAAKYGKKGHHHKGHQTKGFKNTYHKNEYSKKTKFYDSYDNGGYHKKYGGYKGYYGGSKGSKSKGGKHKAGYHGDKYGKKGYDQKGKHHDSHKGEKGHYGHKGKYGSKSSKGKGGGGYGHHDHHGGYGHDHHGYGRSNDFVVNNIGPEVSAPGVGPSAYRGEIGPPSSSYFNRPRNALPEESITTTEWSFPDHSEFNPHTPITYTQPEVVDYSKPLYPINNNDDSEYRHFPLEEPIRDRGRRPPGGGGGFAGYGHDFGTREFNHKPGYEYSGEDYSNDPITTSYPPVRDRRRPDEEEYYIPNKYSDEPDPTSDYFRPSRKPEDDYYRPREPKEDILDDRRPRRPRHYNQHYNSPDYKDSYDEYSEDEYGDYGGYDYALEKEQRHKQKRDEDLQSRQRPPTTFEAELEEATEPYHADIDMKMTTPRPEDRYPPEDEDDPDPTRPRRRKRPRRPRRPKRRPRQSNRPLPPPITPSPSSSGLSRDANEINDDIHSTTEEAFVYHEDLSDPNENVKGYSSGFYKAWASDPKEKPRSRSKKNKKKTAAYAGRPRKGGGSLRSYERPKRPPASPPPVYEPRYRNSNPPPTRISSSQAPRALSTPMSPSNHYFKTHPFSGFHYPNKFNTGLYY